MQTNISKILPKLYKVMETNVKNWKTEKYELLEKYELYRKM